jgi:hypothetical protein
MTRREIVTLLGGVAARRARAAVNAHRLLSRQLASFLLNSATIKLSMGSKRIPTRRRALSDGTGFATTHTAGAASFRPGDV